MKEVFVVMRTTRPAGGGIALLAIAGIAWYGLHHNGVAEAATQPSPSSRSAGTMQVTQWIAQADAALVAYGVPTAELQDTAAVQIIIRGESGGNPRSENDWDSNAVAGHPSKGLMQTIQPTFDAYRIPTLSNDIFDPVANIAAGERYAISRYGSLSNVPGVLAVRAHRAYVGY